MKTDYRKPLVVFSPKSLLRDPRCVSTVEELANGEFQEAIDDTTVNKKDVKTLVFCTGKFYYDIVAERENNGRNDVAVVRIEQLFPLPVEQLKAIIAQYPNADDYVWAQEEPKNMGAYTFMLANFDLVKWRLASLKRIQHRQQEVTPEQNVVTLTLSEWYLTKIYLDSHCEERSNHTNNYKKLFPLFVAIFLFLKKK